MSWLQGKEKCSLLPSTGNPKSGVKPSRDILMWTCDAARDSTRSTRKIYSAMVPWDAFLGLLFTGFFAAGCTYCSLLILRAIRPEFNIPSWVFWLLPDICWMVFPCVFVCMVVMLGQIPRCVIREADMFIIEFITHRRKVPLDQILELVILDDGGQFWALLCKYGIAPFGPDLRFFCGVPSFNGVVCVLLTSNCFWSFAFSLHDPVQFLLDNQRPLDLSAQYKTARRAMLRDGESLDSPRVGMIPGGRRIRVELQHGRRIFVRVENWSAKGKSCGWMSYVSRKGTFLLAKERHDDNRGCGVVGASELLQSYGAAIELTNVTSPIEEDE